MDQENPMRILAIGGAGCSIVEKLIEEPNIKEQAYALNLDARLLNRSLIDRKIQLGARLTRGLGSGGNAAIGTQAALESQDAILRAIKGAEIVVMISGLGGGTGSGVSSVVAQLAKEQGAFLVSVVTYPFLFEGKDRCFLADETLAELRLISDLVLCFDNNLMEKLVDDDGGVINAFDHLNESIAKIVSSIPSMLASKGFLRIGLDDLKSLTVSGKSVCVVGNGEGCESARVSDVVEGLKKTLLLPENFENLVEGALLSIEIGSDVTVSEVEDLVNQVRSLLGDFSDIKIGLTVNAASSSMKAMCFVSIKLLPTAQEAPVLRQTTPILTPVEEVSIPPVQTSVKPQESIVTSPIVTKPVADPICLPGAPSNEFFVTTEPADDADDEIEDSVDDSFELFDDIAPEAPKNEVRFVEKRVIEPETEEVIQEFTSSEKIDDLHRYSNDSENAHTLDRGKFSSSRRLIVDGQDLDLPPALRKS